MTLVVFFLKIWSSKSVFKNDVMQWFLTVDNDLSDRDHSETNPVVYLNVQYHILEKNPSVLLVN